MKRKDIFTLLVIGVVAAFLSSIIAGAVFNSSKQRKEKAPVVTPINKDFPAVANDSRYQAIFNPNALDPTQLIQIGTSQNPSPFNSN